MIPPAQAFVRGPNVVLPASVCRAIDGVLRDVRLRAREDDPLTWAALSALHVVALQSESAGGPSPVAEPVDEQRFHSVKEAAEIAGVTTRSITRAISAGRLRAKRIGTAWLITPAALADYRPRHTTERGDEPR